MLAKRVTDRRKWKGLSSVDYHLTFEVKNNMSLIKNSSIIGLLDTNEWWQTCDTIKLYKTDSEIPYKETELLSVSVGDNQAEFLDLIILMRLYLKQDVRVKDVLHRTRKNLE